MRANIDYLRRKAPRVYLVIPLICGLPEDDMAGFHRSLEWVMRVRPDWLTLYHALVLPGSDFNREAAELGG
ncbi:MAG TPA: hypothetical protein VNK24_03545 [Elusimicrobiota bacterium]|nr:hypothetical protein [Elusimicrobiota bacterium]